LNEQSPTYFDADPGLNCLVMAHASPRSKNAAPAKTKSSTPTKEVNIVPSQKKGYASEGVTDNDVFLLPASDYTVMGLLTLVAMVVRLFRIYQPSSVVFDEVQ
jgi:dolichyl-phosphate-mannose-protein mannosyltransferase